MNISGINVGLGLATAAVLTLPAFAYAPALASCGVADVVK